MCLTIRFEDNLFRRWQVEIKNISGGRYSPILRIKVVRVVNLKLDFTDYCFYNLVVLIKLCKIRYRNYGRPLLFPRNQVFCLKNWKLWRASTTIEFNIFCWNFADVFYLVMSTKACVEFFLFCLDLELLIKV